MKIHFVMQGKGGVGKSFIAGLLAQYYTSKNYQVKCFDLDSLFNTLSNFKALDVTKVNLYKDSKITSERLDKLVGLILDEQADNKVVIVDVGGCCYLALRSYLLKNDIFKVLKENQNEVFINSIAGIGQTEKEFLSELKKLNTDFADENIIIWINEHLSLVGIRKDIIEDGISKDLPHKERIYAMITLEEKGRETFGYNLEQMQSWCLTFDEAIENSEFNLMARQRLVLIRRGFYTEIEKAKI